MDFSFLFNKQKEFDKNFIEHDKNDSIKKKIFALLVELGEAANEKPEMFKYWSSNHKSSSLKNAEYYAKEYNRELIPVKDDPFLEELIDMLHFILSIGNELELSELKQNYSAATRELITVVDLVDTQLRFAREVTNLYIKWKPSPEEADKQDLLEIYTDLMGHFLTFASFLGYGEEALVNAYLKKNKINYNRQQNGY